MQSISAWRWKDSTRKLILSSFFFPFFFLIWMESCYVILVFRPDTVSIPWFRSGKSAYLIIYVIKGHQERVQDKGNPVRSDRFLSGSPRFQFVQTIDYITKLFHQDRIHATKCVNVTVKCRRYSTWNYTDSNKNALRYQAIDNTW